MKCKYGYFSNDNLYKTQVFAIASGILPFTIGQQHPYRNNQVKGWEAVCA